MYCKRVFRKSQYGVKKMHYSLLYFAPCGCSLCGCVFPDYLHMLLTNTITLATCKTGFQLLMKVRGHRIKPVFRVRYTRRVLIPIIYREKKKKKSPLDSRKELHISSPFVVCPLACNVLCFGGVHVLSILWGRKNEMCAQIWSRLRVYSAPTSVGNEAFARKSFKGRGYANRSGHLDRGTEIQIILIFVKCQLQVG